MSKNRVSAGYLRRARKIQNLKPPSYLMVTTKSDVASEAKARAAALQFGYIEEDWPKALGGGKVWRSHGPTPVYCASAEEVCRIHHLLD